MKLKQNLCEAVPTLSWWKRGKGRDTRRLPGAAGCWPDAPCPEQLFAPGSAWSVLPEPHLDLGTLWA